MSRWPGSVRAGECECLMVTLSNLPPTSHQQSHFFWMELPTLPSLNLVHTDSHVAVMSLDGHSIERRRTPP